VDATTVQRPNHRPTVVRSTALGAEATEVQFIDAHLEVGGDQVGECAVGGAGFVVDGHDPDYHVGGGFHLRGAVRRFSFPHLDHPVRSSTARIPGPVSGSTGGH
jgi:hypothetical protein